MRATPGEIRKSKSKAHYDAGLSLSGAESPSSDFLSLFHPQQNSGGPGGCRDIRCETYHISKSYLLKSKKSIMSPIAGLLSGTYGLLLLATGLGKLSRLRLVSGESFQFASMNFRIETWSV